MAKNLFSSRAQARSFAAKHGGRVKDRGKLFDKKRWAVIGAESLPVASKEDREVYRSIAEDYKKKYSKPEAEFIVIMTMKNISVTLPDGKHLVMSRDHEDFKTVAGMFTDGDVGAMVELMSVEKKPREWTFGNGDICVINGVLYHYGMEVPRTSLAKRIIKDCEENNNPEKFVNFFRKLMKNPSYMSVNHTYDFLSHNDLEITDDGDIKAWKKVSASGMASYGVPNFKGVTIMMPRNQVEDNPEVTCSYGLHGAAEAYFKESGHFSTGVLIEISISPEDIVSVPTDYNNSKCRCCKYKVLTGLPRPKGVPKVLLIDKYGKEIKET